MLKTVELSCDRGRQQLWSGINLHLSGGDVLFVRGANGIGKSSLLRMLIGQLQPSSGEIFFQDQPIQFNRYAYHEELLYIGHQTPLKPECNAIENLSFLIQLRGWHASQEEIVKSLNAWKLHGKTLLLPIKQLSQGQKQRVSLAQLNLSKQSIWVLDEPFNSLDSMGSIFLGECLSQHLLANNCLIMTSHLHTSFREIAPSLSANEKLLEF
jgi:heme exporter protein A